MVRRIYTCIILLGQQFGYSGEKESLVSKETVILRRCRSEILKFGIKDVNKSRILHCEDRTKLTFRALVLHESEAVSP